MRFTVKAILSFPKVFVASAVTPGAEAKFSTLALIHKDDPAIAQLESAIQGMKDAFPGGWKSNHKVPMAPASEHNATAGDAKYTDYYVLSCSAKEQYPPHVVDMQRQPLVNRDDVFPGVNAYVAINLYSYNSVYKGIGCGLNAVMTSGEEGALGRLDGRPSVENLFADVGGPVGQPAAPAPAASTPKMADDCEFTYEQLIEAGWTEEQMRNNGYLA